MPRASVTTNNTRVKQAVSTALTHWGQAGDPVWCPKYHGNSYVLALYLNMEYYKNMLPVFNIYKSNY